jgi:hypothetical protein
MKALSIIKYLFTLIGIGLLVGAFLLYQKTNSFIASSMKTEGQIIDLISKRSSGDSSSTYAPEVEYLAYDGKTYRFVSSVSSNPPAYDVGEKVEVLYLEANPNEAQLNGFFSLHLGEFIMGILGTVFFLIGGGILLFGALRNKKREYLIANGTSIQTKIQNVGMNTSVSVNGRHPYIIVSQWLNPATNELHEFESDNIWFDPSDFIKTDVINVLIEQNNPKKYWVDIRFLPKKA